MVGRWTAFDWRAVEDRVNAYPGFRTQIDGQPIHYLHVRSRHDDATPLLLAHTYPGSFLDFLDMIDPLVDPVAHGGRPEDAFHLVIPSMPGFGFSTPVVGDTDWTMARVARAYDVLMRDLGYASYGIHGSDGGAMVGRELAVVDPEGFLGAHVLQLFSFPSGAPGEMDGFGEGARRARAPPVVPVRGRVQHDERVAAADDGRGPRRLARRRPRLPRAVRELRQRTSLVSADQVLAQATLYWLTNSYPTAVRYHYAEQRSGAEPVVSQGRIGVAVFADDFQTIRAFAERDNARIEHWSEHPRGGHYAALEVPLDVVADLRVFFA